MKINYIFFIKNRIIFFGTHFCMQILLGNMRIFIDLRQWPL